MALSPENWNQISQQANNFATTVSAGVSNRKAQNRQFSHNKEMADINFNKNLEMWNMTNQYNTPANQMARFKEAGLNPHLIYGRGESGNASQMPKYQRETVDYQKLKKPFNPLDSLALYQQQKSTQAQTDNLRAQTEVQRIEAKNRAIVGLLEAARIPGVQAESKIKGIIASYQPDMSRLGIEQQDEAISKTIQERKTSESGEKLNKASAMLKALDIEYARKNNTAPMDLPALRAIKEIHSQLGSPINALKDLYNYIRREDKSKKWKL